MALEVLALFCGVLVVVFRAGSGRLLFITRYRQPGIGLGFLCIAVASFLATRQGVPTGRGFDPVVQAVTRPWTS